MTSRSESTNPQSLSDIKYVSDLTRYNNLQQRSANYGLWAKFPSPVFVNKVFLETVTLVHAVLSMAACTLHHHV